MQVRTSLADDLSNGIFVIHVENVSVANRGLALDPNGWSAAFGLANSADRPRFDAAMRARLISGTLGNLGAEVVKPFAAKLHRLARHGIIRWRGDD